MLLTFLVRFSVSVVAICTRSGTSSLYRAISLEFRKLILNRHPLWLTSKSRVKKGDLFPHVSHAGVLVHICALRLD